MATLARSIPAESPPGLIYTDDIQTSYPPGGRDLTALSPDSSGSTLIMPCPEQYERAKETYISPLVSLRTRRDPCYPELSGDRA